MSKQKISVEIIGSNGGKSIIDWNLAVDPDELEDITCKEGLCILSFPGITLKIPKEFCEKVHKAMGYPIL